MKHVFLMQACNILADTNSGLSGSEIISYCVSYGYDYNVDIPHTTQPFRTGNKRTALLENLRKFNDEQKFLIVKELCELDFFKKNREVQNLKMRLISDYGALYQSTMTEIKEIKDTKIDLINYQKAFKHYQSAIEKIELNIYDRNALDDLRLSLELLLKDIFKNEKSLENQKSELGTLFRNNDISTEINNMFIKLIEYFCKYQNNNVKHGDNFSKSDIYFIVDFCSLFMKHIINAHKRL